MKKLKIILLIISIMLLMNGCKNEKKDIVTTNTPSTTSDLTNHKVYEIPTALSKESYSAQDFSTIFAEYLKFNNIKLNTSPEDDKTGMSKEEKLKYYTIYDITPQNVKEEIGCQLFKVNYTCETYVVYNSKIYSIGFGFGGFGLVSIETCDFDNNGKKDLIYTFSWGSGLHRSQIGVFNFSKECEELLDFQQMNEDTMLKKISDNSFNVYIAEVSTEKLDYSNLKFTMKDKVAEVKTVDGKIGIIKYDN